MRSRVRSILPDRYSIVLIPVVSMVVAFAARRAFLFICFRFLGLRPGSTASEWAHSKKWIRACCGFSDRTNEALILWRTRRTLCGLDGKKASLGSIPLVTVNSNKCCLRIASLTNRPTNFFQPRRSRAKQSTRTRTVCESKAVWKRFPSGCQFPPIWIELPTILFQASVRLWQVNAKSMLSIFGN